MGFKNIQLLRNFLLTICVLFSIVSCGSMKEEITLEKDGSGEWVMYTDMVAGAVAMAEQMAIMFQEMDTTGELSSMAENPGEIREMMLEKVWEDFPDKIDSTESLYNMFGDTTFKTDTQREFAKRSTFFMKGSREEGFINSGVKCNFKQIEELEEFMDMMTEMAKEQEGGEMGGFGAGMNSETDYTFSKKKFTRTSKAIGDESMSDQDKMMIEMMMGETTIQTVVRTPRKIKEVIGKGVVRQEKKMVVFEYGLIEMIEDPTVSDFEIIMK